MIRIIHTACAAALVLVALIAHGIKEEKRALDGEKKRLVAEKAALAAAIDREQVEWAHLNSPDSLRRIAEHVYGAGPWSLQEGSSASASAAGLAPIAARQVVDIRALPYRNTALRDAARGPIYRGGGVDLDGVNLGGATGDDAEAVR